MLSLKQLTKVYRTTEAEMTAMRSVDFRVAAAEFLAVMGPSGCDSASARR